LKWEEVELKIFLVVQRKNNQLRKMKKVQQEIEEAERLKFMNEQRRETRANREKNTRYLRRF
jgi:hypothetical protein